MIKSHLLYQLSYGVIVCLSGCCFPIASAKLQTFFELTKFFLIFFVGVSVLIESYGMGACVEGVEGTCLKDN